MEEYRGYTIRKSGKGWLRVYDAKSNGTTPRVKSIEAGKALIDCLIEHRVMTSDEYKLIHGIVEPVMNAYFEEAIKKAQALADLYHAPYYVARGKFIPWTVSAVKGKVQVLPSDGKVYQDIVIK